MRSKRKLPPIRYRLPKALSGPLDDKMLENMLLMLKKSSKLRPGVLLCAIGLLTNNTQLTQLRKKLMPFRSNFFSKAHIDYDGENLYNYITIINELLLYIKNHIAIPNTGLPPERKLFFIGFINQFLPHYQELEGLLRLENALLEAEPNKLKSPHNITIEEFKYLKTAQNSCAQFALGVGFELSLDCDRSIHKAIESYLKSKTSVGFLRALELALIFDADKSIQISEKIEFWEKMQTHCTDFSFIDAIYSTKFLIHSLFDCDNLLLGRTVIAYGIIESSFYKNTRERKNTMMIFNEEFDFFSPLSLEPNPENLCLEAAMKLVDLTKLIEKQNRCNHIDNTTYIQELISSIKQLKNPYFSKKLDVLLNQKVEEKCSSSKISMEKGKGEIDDEEIPYEDTRDHRFFCDPYHSDDGVVTIGEDSYSSSDSGFFGARSCPEIRMRLMSQDAEERHFDLWEHWASLDKASSIHSDTWLEIGECWTIKKP